MRVVKGGVFVNKYNDVAINDILKSFMIENSISESALSTILNMNRKTLRAILNGEDLKVSHAIRIAKLLNISSDTLINSYLKEADQADLDIIQHTETISYLLENFDLIELKSSKIISSSIDFKLIEEELCRYFGYKNIEEYDNLRLKTPLFSKSNISVKPSREKKMQDFWIKSNLESFKKINNSNEYNKDLLIDFLKRINPLTKDIENGFSHAIYVLYHIGVTVMVQPYLSKTKAFGVTMLVDEKPCIVITDMGKKYHKLWLTLLHELYHVLEDYDFLKATNYHISDSEEKDVFLSEDNADLFALEIFVPYKKMNILNQIISYNYKVNKMAEMIDVHPSILYGVYLESAEKKIQTRDFPKYSKYLLSSKNSIKRIAFDAIGKRSIELAAKEMKKNLNILTA